MVRGIGKPGARGIVWVKGGTGVTPRILAISEDVVKPATVAEVLERNYLMEDAARRIREARCPRKWSY
jgi:tetraacyldisaccharide-1-P 4'-kinase